jgi:nucleotide-binding universal stress UspA family protein
MADRIHRYVVGLDRSELGLLAVVILHGVIGPAAEALIATAAVLAADAIFVGTHGRTGLRRAFLGSELRWPTHHRQIAIR